MTHFIKKEIVDFGVKLVEEGYTAGAGGNLSFFDRKEGRVYLSPSSIDFHKVKSKMVCVLDIEGNHLEGNFRPSTEWPMHKLIYEKRPDVNAIIHGHTIYSTALSLLGQGLPASHYMVAVAGGQVRCVDYEIYGSEELAMKAVEGLEGRYAVILANHGLITCGKNLGQAFSVLREVEYCSRIHLLAESAGQVNLLSQEDFDKVIDKFGTRVDLKTFSCYNDNN